MAYISFYPNYAGIGPEKAERMFLALTGKYKLETRREDDGCISVSFPYDWNQAEGFRREYQALIKRILIEGEIEGYCAKISFDNKALPLVGVSPN